MMLVCDLQMLDSQLRKIELAFVGRARVLQSQPLRIARVQLTLLGSQLLLVECLLLMKKSETRRLLARTSRCTGDAWP